MRRIELRAGLPAAMLLLGGCFSPQELQMPRFGPRPPALEKLSYEFHDPFPDNQLGPEINHRPPGFREQRAQPRDLKEARAMVDRLRFLPEAPPQSPELGSRYPHVVRPE